MGTKKIKFDATMAMEIAGLKLKNPVMTASGTFGYGEEYADY
ncbi:MAG: dihydroorotate dehydrogenase, partial [Deltaproteobacteria bacterium HGW-Deltaproteobacteria-7]